MSKLWGSRFKKGTAPLADKFTFSISYDHKLAKYDVLGSIAHAKMLGRCRIIPQADANKIVAGLNKILTTIKKGEFKFDAQVEDIHSNIQDVLKKSIGPAADKLHTARSRNDQIVLDVKLYCLDQLPEIIRGIHGLQKAILQLAQKNKDVIIPAYTHLQAAQVVLLAHHLLAYIEMLERDKSRIIDTIKRTRVMPLGSCALSGTSLPIDRNFVAKQLGFSQVTQNSIDSVSDRDFIAESMADIALLAMHFSRMAEDLIIWATKEFNFIDIDWAFCTGSSIMPHKKNPDVLELIRGETGKFYNYLNDILILLKGLPLTYNRDLQLDKPSLFSAVDRIKQILELMTALFKGISVKRAVLTSRIEDESFFSVDVMEYLIKKGVSYREAHEIIGTIVKDCLDNGQKIADLSEKQLQKYSKKFSHDVKLLLNAKTSVQLKKSWGSTNPKLVHGQLAHWKKVLK